MALPVSMDFAYLARGRLFVQLGDEEPREIESGFAQDVAARASRLARKNAWKTQGRGARFMMGLGGAPEDLLEGEAPAAAAIFTGVSRGRHGGEVLYSLQSGPVTGAFAFTEGEEVRLFHGADTSISAVSVSDDGRRIACAASARAGWSHLAIMAGDGSELTFVTEGDCFDGAPRFVPGSSDRLVYESRGMGYDRMGRPVSLGTAAVLELDLSEGTLSPRAEDPRFDFLCPRVADDGTLYCIRRPRIKEQLPVADLILDVLLFPFRLLRAVFQWLNFFTIRHTGQPLSTAGGARGRRADLRQLLQMGNVVNAAHDANDAEDDAPLAESSSVLVRLRENEEERLASSVVAFDLAPDGAVLYTDGRRIVLRLPSGEEKVLRKDKAITRVVVLATAEC